MSITALVHTRNESSFLTDCLKSLAWADEIVVADMASTDGTREIAVKHGAKVLDMPIAPIVEFVRDKALKLCKSDWVLILDPDERAQVALAERLREIERLNKHAACQIPRKNYFLGEWMQHGCWPDHQTRFVRPNCVTWPSIVHDQPKVNGETIWLEADPSLALEHPGYASDLGTFMAKGLRYSRMDALRLLEKQNPSFWPFLFRRPLGEFFGRYFVMQSWRHGTHGLAWSLAASMYELQVALHYWDLTRATQTQPAPDKLRKNVIFECLRSNSKWLSAILRK